jgi:ubiquinone/menaquinone biosynthesis C-methylase UbiE
MPAMAEDMLSHMLQDTTRLRTVEPGIYSVLPNDETGNEYDSQFGFIYDLVACNPLYNRAIWGYSVQIFAQTAEEALRSSSNGPFLDIGCGSLAFTAKTYCHHTERPLVLADQSLKMLKMAKERVLKLQGSIPDNICFLHADAVHLPFHENAFSTVLSENLLHCLDDTQILLNQLKSIVANDGRLFFTTLVRADRLADKYLETLAASDKLVSRTAMDHKSTFDAIGLTTKFQHFGNLLTIRGNT